MTDQQERVVRVLVNLLVSGFTVGILLYIAWPGFKDRLREGGEWARYYRWRAWWSSLPPHLREAAIVRGKGPVE